MSIRAALRALSTPVGAIGAAIVLVGGTGVATAATGGSMILGRTNYAGGPTALRNTGGGSALHLGTASNAVPPLTVGTNKTRVPYLNSDLVDGLDSTQLQRRIAAACPGGAITAVGTTGGVTCAALPKKINVSVAKGDSAVGTFDGVTLRVSCTVVEEFEGPRLFAHLYLTGAGIVNGFATSMPYDATVTTEPVGAAIPAAGTSAKLATIQAPELAFSRQVSTLMVVNAGRLTQLTLHLFADARDLAGKPCTVWGTAI